MVHIAKIGASYFFVFVTGVRATATMRLLPTPSSMGSMRQKLLRGANSVSNTIIIHVGKETY
jgi:hypothetical protein